MKTHYYIKNNRPKLPILFTAITYLFMDRFNAPEWLWGVISVFILIIWAALIYVIVNSKRVDVLILLNNIMEEKDITIKNPKITFSDKMEQMIKESKIKQDESKA